MRIKLFLSHLHDSIGSIFFVPSPVSTNAGLNFLTSGSSSDGRYNDMVQLKSGKMCGM